jgi:crossover junction endodeoxyribonuclease RuvC
VENESCGPLAPARQARVSGLKFRSFGPPKAHRREKFRPAGVRSTVLAHAATKKVWPRTVPRRTLSAMSQTCRTKGVFFRVLGVDPAAAGATGYGVIESDGRRCTMLRFGALRATRKGPEHFPERLCEIHSMLSELIEEFEPQDVAVESVFTALNMRTALKLAEVRGVVLLAAAQRYIPVHSYSPREVKACVAGYGHAGKQQMQQMVRVLLGMSETPEPADAADALAVALCHVQAAQFRARLDAGAARAAADKPALAIRARGSHSRIADSRI